MECSDTVFCPIIKAPQVAPRGLCAVKVCDDYGVRHNSDHDLCGTENECANRLRLLIVIALNPNKLDKRNDSYNVDC